MRERVGWMRWVLALAAGPAAAALASLRAPRSTGLRNSPRIPQPPGRRCDQGHRVAYQSRREGRRILIRAQLQARGAFPPQLEWCTSAALRRHQQSGVRAHAEGGPQPRAVAVDSTLSALLDSLRIRHRCGGHVGADAWANRHTDTVGKELANIAARLQGQRQDSSASSSWAK